MQRLVKDMLTLTRLNLPASFDRKRIILNFVSLYCLSVISRITSGFSRAPRWQQTNVKIDSEIWQSFNHIISMYVKYLSPRYLLQTYVIRGVATGWHSKSYIDFLKGNFTKEHLDRIPLRLLTKVEQVSNALSKEFAGLQEDTVNRWLSTYQFGLSDFHTSADELTEKLENTLIIELGAGTGANAAVHASISNKGVYIFDIPPMLQLQQRIMNKIEKSVDLSPVTYFHDPQELIKAAKQQPYIVVSYWAFTEFPENLRKTLDPLIEHSDFSFFACNSHFEGIDNLDYFKELPMRLKNKDVQSRPISWNPYKNHSYVMVK